MSSGDEHDHKDIETTPAEQVTVPAFPPGSVAIEAAEDSKKDDRANATVAKDDHRDRGQTRTLRVVFSGVVTLLVFGWMIAIYALLLFQGTNVCFGRRFELSEKTMLGALGTVTLNVIGLLVIILRFVFPVRSEDDKHRP